MVNPFEEFNPFISDSKPPRKEVNNESSDLNTFLDQRHHRTPELPQTPKKAYSGVENSFIRRSPDVFSRSIANQAVIPPILSESDVPDLGYEPIKTPRGRYTSQESPKRDRHRAIIVNDYTDHNLSPSRLNNSSQTSNSGRILEPPKPIFSRETFDEANSQNHGSSDASTLHSDVDRNYAYKAYQEEFEALEGYSDEETVTSHDTHNDHSSKSESEYFGASLDHDMMKNLNNGYVPQNRKALHKRKVRVVGQSGNLVLENRIPDELKKVLTRTESPFGEFTNMTYTACTSEPDDFVADGFSLRASKYGRETELVICVTMYNEDEHSFARTMHGIMKNVSHLCSRSKSSVWGKDSWKKVQVIIISDGRNKVNPAVLQLLAATGCYQDNLARPYVNTNRVRAHIFEYTTQISIDENLKFKGDEKNLTPVQVLFCLKEQNQKKINSHRWLFNAFCPVLDPNVVILLDVGTKPDNHAIYNLWKAFDRDSNVAGAAGEIVAMKGKGWVNLLNPLVASQNFEYKMSNILDKPLESAFGYISVLPGALSAYRYIALKNHSDGTGPLNSYFKGEDLLTNHHQRNSKTNFFEANMYLAEDRILCWELVAKRNESWVLKFVKLATGETDVPETVPEFLSQRRRWMNGAFFAALYSLRNANSIWYTDHSYTRKFFFCMEFFYQFVNLVFSFFSLSHFYLTFYFLTGSLITNKHVGRFGFWIFTIFNYLCICVLTSIFIASIGNRPQASRRIFKNLMILLTVCALYALIVGFYFVVSTINDYGKSEVSTYVFLSIVVSLLATYGLYVLMSVLYLDPWHMITCSVQYMLMLPSYTCTLQIFAFCNTHDVSWGTKGDNNPKDDKNNQYIIEKNEEGEFEAIVMDYNIDEFYLETLYSIRAKRSNKKIKTSDSSPHTLDGDDYAKNVRTKVVLIWLLSNLIFIMTMLQVYQPGETARNYYLAFILWTVAILALIRAIGSTAYILQNLARKFVEFFSKAAYKKNGYASAANSLN